MTWFLVAHQALYLVDIPSGYNPNASGIPGAGTLMDVTNWVAFIVLGWSFINPANPIRGIIGDEAPWKLDAARGFLAIDGHLLIRVRGLIFGRGPRQRERDGRRGPSGRG